MRVRGAEREETPEGIHLSLPDDGVQEMCIQTPRGGLVGVAHPAPGATRGVLMVGGAGGGVTGPASIYPDLAEGLLADGITSVRLDYRRPNALNACVYDTLAGVTALGQLGVERVAIIGWSFGGAVAIAAGALGERVVGVATVASQSYGTDAAAALAPRSLLLLHGAADRTLPTDCSLDIYRRAGEPKEIEIYPGANHGLDQVREEMRSRLLTWLRRVLGEERNA